MQLEHLKNIEDLNRLRLPFTLERIKMSKLRFLQNIIIFQLKKNSFSIRLIVCEILRAYKSCCGGRELSGVA